MLFSLFPSRAFLLWSTQKPSSSRIRKHERSQKENARARCFQAFKLELTPSLRVFPVYKGNITRNQNAREEQKKNYADINTNGRTSERRMRGRLQFCFSSIPMEVEIDYVIEHKLLLAHKTCGKKGHAETKEEGKNGKAKEVKLQVEPYSPQKEYHMKKCLNKRQWVAGGATEEEIGKRVGFNANRSNTKMPVWYGQRDGTCPLSLPRRMSLSFLL